MKLQKQLLVFISLTCLPLAGTDGRLDTTFNPTGNPPGTVTTNIKQSSNSFANSVVVQADNKIIAGGAVTIGGVEQFALVRYNVDGSLDSAFGSGGIVTTIIGTNASINAVALQTDGKIVVAGTANPGGNTSFAIARYNTNGTLDGTFNPSGTPAGTVITSIGTSANANSIALQTDGKIVVGGNANPLGVHSFAIARYNTNGTLDATFNPSGTPAGTAVTPIPSSIVSQCASIAIQVDSKIVAGGYAIDGGGNFAFALARYNTNGSLDGTFNSGGTLIFPIGTDSYIQSIVLQPDGKIVAGGAATIGGINQFTLARYNSDGSSDGAFGSKGVVFTDIGNVNSQIDAIVLQPDTKIIAGGLAFINGNDQFALARYNTDGSLDSSFGSGGIVITTIINATYSNTIDSIFLQPNGKLVAAGFNEAVSGDTFFAVARYTAFTIFKESAIAKAIRQKYCPTGTLR